MIKTVWNNIQRQLQLLINNQNAETGILLQKIDLAQFFNRGDVASIELDLFVQPGTAPGASKNLTMWVAWCSNSYRTPAELLTAAASTTCAIPSTANTHAVFMAPQYYQGAQYLMIWFDHDAFNSGAVLELNLSVNAKTG